MGSINLKNFTLDEFDSPDLPTSGQEMDYVFLSKLDNARDIANIPFRITSGYRTASHNKQVGGVPDSAHTKGRAVDIAATGGRERYVIINALQQAGFNRIGISNSFIHVDDDPSKPEQVIWTYN